MGVSDGDATTRAHSVQRRLTHDPELYVTELGPATLALRLVASAKTATRGSHVNWKRRDGTKLELEPPICFDHDLLLTAFEQARVEQERLASLRERDMRRHRRREVVGHEGIVSWSTWPRERRLFFRRGRLD